MEDLKSFRTIHFVGIGGIGMSAIASVLLAKGFRVAGSDVSRNRVVERLEREGATVHLGHRAENVEGADLVVASSAIRRDNPELLAAAAKSIPVWRRARVLAEIMKAGRSVAVAGTHGKTTTTSMLALALVEGGFDPTAVIGAELDVFDSNARVGRGEWIVAEADESDGSFLDYEPDRIAVTNLEADHMDYYRDMDHLRDTFASFFKRLRPGGKIVACADSPELAAVIRREGIDALTYSNNGKDADLKVRAIRHLNKSVGVRFTPVYRGKELAPVRLRVPGRQNVQNALAVILLALDIGCPYDAVVRALGRYTGAKRRFQIKGEAAGVTVVDDYAHHPTEIEATLAAARATVGRRGDRRVVGVFQPHRYSRTQSLQKEFGAAFGDADLVVVTDVYGAGESPIEGVTGENVIRSVAERGHPNAHYVPKTADVAEFLGSRLREGDMVLTLGAGDVWRLGDTLLSDLRSRDLKNGALRAVDSALQAICVPVKGGVAGLSTV